MAIAIETQQLNDPALGQARSGIFGLRLPQFDTAGGTAFAHAKDPATFLLVHKRSIPLRANVLEALNRVRNNAIIKLKEQQILRINGEERLVSFFELPMGDPVLSMETGRRHPVAERDIRHIILPQLYVSLRALHEYGLPHRALHPGRLFYRSQDKTEIVLGECFSAPAGEGLPSVFETTERSMAQPGFRGAGQTSDDYYALGATLLSLLMGRDLQGGRTDQQILQAKLTQGSFAALSGGEDLPGSITLLIRGLLTDNVEDRWGANEVSDWLEGSPPRVHGSLNPWSLSRPVGFCGRNYTDRRFLARAMAADIASASAYIRRQDMAHWIPQFLPRVSITPELVNLVTVGDIHARTPAQYNTLDHLVSRFCALLDPVGPIRFRNIVVMGDALGALLSSAVVRQGGDRLFNDIAALSQGGFLKALSEIRVLSCPDEKCKESARIKLKIDALPSEMKADDEGLLRLVYELNPGLVCQSPLFQGYWVDGPDTALRILDKNAEGNPNAELIDPHIGAFLLSHFQQRGSRFNGKNLSMRASELQNSLLLELFGGIQERFDLGPLKGLSSLFATRIAPQIKKLKSKTRREGAQKRLNAMIEAGDLSKLAMGFDMTRILAADERDWRRATQKLKMIDLTLRKLSRPMAPNDPKALYRGAQAASMVGAVVLFATIFIKVI